MQGLELLFEPEPEKVERLWLPQHRQLVRLARPRLVVARELPPQRRQQHQASRPLRQAPPLAHRTRLHPRNLDLDDFELVPLELAQAAPATSPARASQTAILSTPLPEPLSARERELLHALAEGDTNRELAARFYISVGTVRWHLTNIYGKLGVQRRTQALARARSLGLLSAESTSAQP